MHTPTTPILLVLVFSPASFHINVLLQFLSFFSVTDCQYLSNLASQGQKDFSPVTDCMEHALTGVHPHTCYFAGWDSKFFTLPLSYLPTSVADFILSLAANVEKPTDAV